MTKNTYLHRLKNALNGVPREEAEKLLEYYRELIDDGIESGKSEESVVGELEPPEVVAENYRRETGHQSSATEPKLAPAPTAPAPQKTDDGERILKILGAILGIFVAFVGAIVLFSFGIASFSIFLSGLIVFITSFGVLYEPAVAVAQMGTGFLLLGLGLLFFCLTSLIGKGYARLLRILFFSPEKTKPVRMRKTVIPLAISGGLFVFGLIVFLAGFGALGFHYENLWFKEDIVTKTESITDEFDSFQFKADDLSLEVKYSVREETIIEWHELKSDERLYFYSNGVTTLKSPYTGWNSFKRFWERGFWFSILPSELNEATLYLPASYSGSLSVELKNGAVVIENMSFDNLNLLTRNGAIKVGNCGGNTLEAETDNGAIQVRGGTFGTIKASTDNGTVQFNHLTAESISAETSNGAVRLEYCTAEVISGETNNGAVVAERITANNIILRTDNGAVRGTIVGRQSEYNIDAKTNLGKCNLTSRHDPTLEKQLNVRTSNGAINLSFTD